MIISSPEDYRSAAQQKLPRFLFDYIDGGANSEHTLKRNEAEFKNVRLRQRVLKGSENISLSTQLFDSSLSLPVVLAPVGLTGMYRRRGEVQAARAAAKVGIPTSLSTVSVCSIDEVAKKSSADMWFQLYVLKDRAFMKDALDRAIEAGVTTLVFTVDMPVPGSRYRDAHSGMSGPFSEIKRIMQAITHPEWAIDVGLLGHPHDLGNISKYLGKTTGLADYIGWLGANFDPEIGWKDLEWIRDYWPGKLIIKGILDKDDVPDATQFGADGLVVSNHGGRQLDGVQSTIEALPHIVEAADGKAKILLDSGIRNGLDVVRALCLGADSVLIGRSYIYALATGGQSAVENLLDLYAKEMKVAMTLMGASSIDELSEDKLIN